MPKTVDEIRPNLAPVYAASLYPDLCKLTQRHGYALAVHGSLAHDFDLICVPWVDNPSPPGVVVLEIVLHFHSWAEYKVTDKPCGRQAVVVHIGHGESRCDLSFVGSPRFDRSIWPPERANYPERWDADHYHKWRFELEKDGTVSYRDRPVRNYFCKCGRHITTFGPYREEEEVHPQCRDLPDK